jgi:predicted unusual protein kinase regulating ubiquinone biosynthesis (AarF/ABC1/UbiB family)
MKQQLSPQALLQDLKRDWPRWRAVLADLPDHLQRLADHSIDENSATNKKLATAQDRANRLAVFHQVLGFGTALCGLIIYVCGENAIIDHSLLTDLSPIYGTAGIVWAYLKSR